LRSPLWKGGGNVHGPQPRDWSYNIPKKMRRGAIRSVLSERLREGGLVIVESFELASHKTKELSATLEGLGLNKRLLVVDSTSNGKLVLSSRNLREVTLVSASGVNVYDLLTHEHIALTRDAAVQLEKQLSNG
jgi:large subunit ribosomal protein L4